MKSIFFGHRCETASNVYRGGNDHVFKLVANDMTKQDDDVVLVVEDESVHQRRKFQITSDQTEDTEKICLQVLTPSTSATYEMLVLRNPDFSLTLTVVALPALCLVRCWTYCT
jgi:hypothetical protein